MAYTAAELTAMIGSLLWPFFRISAMLMVAPITGAQNVPVPARLAIALALTLVVVPVLPEVPAVEAFSLTSLLITLHQILIGAAMGFALLLVFNAFVTGGQVVAMQMGLGFASMVDPQNGQQVPVIGQLYLMLATLLFLSLDGHLLLIRMLVESFHVMPIGQRGLSAGAMQALAGFGSTFFASAVWLALPALGALLIISIAFGIMARAAPQLNIFGIGFPVKLMMGFVVILVVLPTLVPQLQALLEAVYALLWSVLAGGN